MTFKMTAHIDELTNLAIDTSSKAKIDVIIDVVFDTIFVTLTGVNGKDL